MVVEPQLDDLGTLDTEARNANTLELDALEPEALVALMHTESRTAFDAVERALPEVAIAVRMVTRCLAAGGRLFYVGAGTSGRLGVLDASECPPTFGVDRGMVQAIIAGGPDAITASIEGAEDSAATGADDLRSRGVAAGDIVIGIAASGRTPYVAGALGAARVLGAAAVAIVNVRSAALAEFADLIIAAVTGPEALTGSTRLKAGTAQKLILNLITTAAMVGLGKVYSNLMVDVKATNRKLRDRAVRIVEVAAGVDRTAAGAALNAADGEVKTAIVMLARHVSPEEARSHLAASNGWVRRALI